MPLHPLPLCMLSLLALAAALSHPALYARGPDPGPALHPRPAPVHAPPPRLLHARADPVRPRGTLFSALASGRAAADWTPTCSGNAKTYCEQRCACRTTNRHLYCDKLSSEWAGARKLHLRRQLVVFCAPACNCEVGKGGGGEAVEGEGEGGGGTVGKGGEGGEERDKGVFGVLG